MYELSIPSMLCVWCSPCSSQDNQYGSMICNVAMLWLLLTSSLFSLFLKAYSPFFCMTTMRNAQSKIAIGYIREQSCDTRDDMLPIWYGKYVCNGRCRSLMCTSIVADNTQMASLDRQVTQNGLGVNNAMAREYTMEGYHDTKMIWR